MEREEDGKQEKDITEEKMEEKGKRKGKQRGKTDKWSVRKRRL